MTKKIDFNPFGGPALGAVIPMTASQKELWMAADQSDAASCAFNLSVSVFLNGKLELSVLQQALDALTGRHESLRGSFGANTLSMCIAESIDVPIQALDLSGESPEKQEQRRADIRREEASKPFDLIFGPLIRARVAILAADQAILFVSFHHLVVDGWSLDLLLKELAELYSSIIEGRPSNLLPAYQFSDYAAWVKSEYETARAEEADRYWLDQFKEKAPTLELPLDFSRPGKRSYSAERVVHPIEGEFAAAIFNAASEQKSTFFIFAFAAYVALIHRITDQDDIVIAVPAAGHLDVGENQLAGHCVNTLPIRCKIKEGMTFSELLLAVRKQVYDGYGHTPFTYSNLMGRVPMDRDMARPPLASLIMTVDQESHELPFHGIESHYRLNPRAYEVFEMQVSLVSESRDRIEIQCQYNVDLFERASAEGRMRDFASLLHAAADRPDELLTKLPILSDADKEAVDSWNATEAAYPTGVTMHGLFEQQADTTPDNIALEFEGHTLTYAELDKRSNKVAAYLKDRGVAPEKMVCICMDRSIEMIVAMYGTLKAGGAYVPLDPEYPHERLSFMLEDTEASVVLTQEHLQGAIPETTADVVCLDSEWARLESYSDARSELEVDERTLAYTLYTSGSTGRPKGVINEHRGICNQLFWMREHFNSDESDTILLKTPYSFDVSIWEIFYPLATGARVVIAPPGAHRDPEQLAELFRDHGVTGTCFVPSLLSVFVNSAHAAPAALRWIISIGEALTPETVQRFHEKLPGVGLHNLYGPTEAAVGVTYWECESDAKTHVVPIGKPMGNVKIYVLDRHRQPVPVGVAGELYIGGVQTCRGYLNRDELTKDVFIDDPFIDDPGAIMYRTGDRARWTNQGVVEYLGRIDFQVKVRGLRIELGEIESVLAEHEAIANAVVVVNQSRPDEQRLVAYYSGPADPGAAALRVHLGNTLPPYMIPQIFMYVDELPMLTSGKVDRKALPEPVADVSASKAARVKPHNNIEETIAGLWEEFLQIGGVDVEQTFFDQGGSSLLALRLVGKLAEVFETRIPVARFFEYSTVASFSEWLEEEGIARATAAEVQELDEEPVPDKPTRSVRGAAHDIAIVGMAGKFPEAANIEEFWQNLLDGRDCITHFSEDEIDSSVDKEIAGRPNYVRARGLMPDIDAFDAKFFGVRPREAQIMDPQQRIFIETCWHALEDSAYDSGRFEGKIGVFAGTGDNTYLWNYVLKDRDVVSALGEHQTHILNERDYLTTRVAYKLDLRGPAVAIGTACSTGLVAVCHAVESLRAGNCDAAIAGGIYVPAPDHTGYLYQEGGISSADGTCRPFDKDADGTVFSSGTAAVVLRRLEEAEAGGDRIYGVIRGVATNNDGADKMSFMAPSAIGQSEVIRSAVADSGVDARDVIYVEAHGTATPIGDPIEFSALKSALGTSSDGQRWLGSVKSNIGHLDAAAGTAGLIKTALALHTGILPGTVHFNEANPELEIAKSDFSVTTDNIHWKDNRDSMVAGVSSFGIGGTNAHVIVQSYDGQHEPSPARDQELLLLSADSPSQLSVVAKNLADHFDKTGTGVVSDAGFTLARGRKRLAYRAAVAADSNAATEALRELAEKPVTVHPAGKPGVSFMFPGQGSQHIGMGLGLYEHSAAFRKAFDYGAESLKASLNIDLRDLIFGRSPGDEMSSQLLMQTRLAQPALYILQYAMAQHWMSWGLTPSVVFGHSIGEFAAATIAGVMSYDSGLDLVAARGRLVGDQPAGSMLSVRARSEIVDRYLSEFVELAAVNSPELCVVSGGDEAIRGVLERLESDGIAASALHTSHAFHSSMMEPARQEFRKIVAQHVLSAPTTEMISTLTGERISDEEATDPEYWARQLRYGVRFSGAVRTAWRKRKPVLLEVGPRHTATTLARQHIENRDRERAVASLDGATTAAAEWNSILRAAGELWCSGIELDWDQVYEAPNRRVVSVPAYPFRRSRYWIGRPIVDVNDDESGDEYATIADPVCKKITDMIEHGSGITILQSDLNRTFLDIGLDSLYLAQFGIQLQNEFGVPVGLRELIESYSTVAELAAFVRSESDDLPEFEAPTETVASHAGMEAFYFGKSRKLMGFFQPPTSGSRNHAVLIVAPLLNEYMRSYASLRQLGSMLADQGFSVLRFDFEGIGNSLGQLEETRIATWQDNLREALDELATRSECDRISVVSVRFSAALMSNIAKTQSIDRVVMWDPIADGASWLKGLEVVESEHLKLFDSPDMLSDREFHGHVVGSDFTTELRDWTSVLPKANRCAVVLSEGMELPSDMAAGVSDTITVPFDCKWEAVTSQVMYSNELVACIIGALR